MNKVAMTKWVPETDPAILRRVGKTGEECAELAKVCSRITIQGMDGIDPATGISNREALAKEMADVIAQCQINIKTFGLDAISIGFRVDDKVAQMAEWEAMFQPDSLDEAETTLVNELRTALKRYRDEVPLGHQPHMLAHKVDELLERSQTNLTAT